MTVEIFSPATKDVKNYQVGEIKPVTINSQAIIPILADKIYKDPLSAIRELYNNEVTACKKTLRENPETKPHIEIRFNPDNRELKITGIDSLGIDLQTFNEIVTVMGNSGNNTGEDIGYFGLGFYSYVKISERCILKTYSRKSNEKYALIGKSALSFELLSKDLYTDLNQYGTEIILSVKDGIKEETITNKIIEITRLSGVETTYFIKDDIYPIKQFKGIKEYFENYYSSYYKNNNPNYSLVYEYFENDDYELIIGYTMHNYHNIGNGGEIEDLKECYLVNTPISLSEDKIREILGYREPTYLINLKNERKFKPKPDREQLEQASEIEVLTVIKDHVKDNINNTLEKKTYQNVKEWYADKQKYFHAPEILGCYKTKSCTNSGNTVYSDYLMRNLKKFLDFEEITEFCISKRIRKDVFASLAEKGVFCIAVFDDNDYEGLINFGFIELKKYLGKNKIKREKSTKTKTFVFHGSHDYKVGQVKDNDIVFKTDNIKGVIEKIKHFGYKTDPMIWIISDNADYKRAIDISKIKDMLWNKIFVTNKGLMTYQDIITNHNKFSFYAYDNDFFNQSVFMNTTKYKGIVIYGSGFNEELFRLEAQINQKYQYNHQDNLYEISEKDIINPYLRELISSNYYSLKCNRKVFNAIKGLNK